MTTWNQLLQTLSEEFGVAQAAPSSELPRAPNWLALPSEDDPVSIAAGSPLSALSSVPAHIPESIVARNPSELISRAGRHLDRALLDRAQWQEFGEKAFRLFLELQEFVWTNQVHIKEEEDGFYREEISKSEAEISRLNTSIEAATTELRSLETLLEAEFKPQRLEELAINYASGPWAANHSVKTAFGYGPWRIRSRKPRDHLFLGSRDYSLHALRTTRERFLARKATLESELAGLKTQLSERTWQSKWYHSKAEHAKERTDIRRNLHALKAVAASQDGGALNYLERMRPIGVRLAADITQARGLLSSARTALIRLYGLRGLEATNPHTATFDQLIHIARNYDASYLHVMRRSHATTFSVAITGKDWRNGLAAARWSARFDASALPDWAVGLVRSISIEVLGFRPNQGGYAFRAFPPRQGRLDRGLLGSETVDQSDVGVCHIGSARSVDSPRTPERFGSDMLFDVVPIGDSADDVWAFEALRPHSFQDELSKADGIVVQWQICCVPRQLD